MFCPKCGGQNADETAYCRHCGEDLKIISQAMRGHAPFEIASKIDSVIGTGYERFRRDAILWLFWCLVFTAVMFGRIFWISGGVQFFPPKPGSPVFIAFFLVSIPSLIMFAAAAWNVLLFRRARQLTTTPKAQSETAGEERTFCPACGTQNNGSAKLCSSCGFNLELLYGDRPADHLLIRQLDHSLERRSLRRPRSRRIWRIALGAIFWLFLAVFQFVYGNWGDTILYSLLALTRTSVKLWDMIYFERQQKLEQLKGRHFFNGQEINREGDSELETARLEAETQRQLADPVKTEFDTIRLTDLAKQPVDND